jgi:hypothetical protein
MCTRVEFGGSWFLRNGNGGRNSSLMPTVLLVCACDTEKKIVTEDKNKAGENQNEDLDRPKDNLCLDFLPK